MLDTKKRPNRDRPQVGVTLSYDVWARLQRERNRSATVELALRLYYNLPPEGFERFRDA
jgi:hypothetical protein